MVVCVSFAIDSLGDADAACVGAELVGGEDKARD